MLKDIQAQINNDLRLPMIDKIELIKGIEYWQKERFKRLGKWRKIKDLPISIKHTFLKTEIDLIRSQAIRLKAVKQSIYG